MSAAFATSLFDHFELPFAHHIAKLRLFLTTYFGKAFWPLGLACWQPLVHHFHGERAGPVRFKNRRCQCVG